MTIIYTSEIFSHHDTGKHPESVRRSQILHEYFGGLEGCFVTGEVPSLSGLGLGSMPLAERMIGKNSLGKSPWFRALESVHRLPLIERVYAQCQSGGGSLDPDTRVSQESFEVALTAVATLCQGVDDVMKGRASNALSLARPPGHHATGDQSMGFCLFNNIAVAARYAQNQYGLDRVLIIDWDVHHGNGTQDIFYEDPSVGFLSIHRFPFYPGSGHEDEQGSGRGKGTTFNVPIAYGTSRQSYLEAFSRAVEKAAQVIKPDLILISAGFDAHALDPIGDLGLTTEDFGVMTDLVMEVAQSTCQGRLVSSLEGGYHLEALRDSVATHAERLGAKRGS